MVDLDYLNQPRFRPGHSRKLVESFWLKANDPNLASAQVGFTTWKTNAVLPLATLIEQKLNERYIPLFGLEGEAVLAWVVFESGRRAISAYDFDIRPLSGDPLGRPVGHARRGTEQEHT